MHLIHGRLPIRELDACQPGSRNDRLRKGRVQNCRTRKVVLQYAEMMYVSAYCSPVHLTLLARTSNSSKNLPAQPRSHVERREIASSSQGPSLNP